MSLRILSLASMASALLMLSGCASIPKGAYQAGKASWYGAKFQGRKTASGEFFNMNEMTAAHPFLKFGTQVKVVSQSSGRSVVVRINDRGPFHGGRIIDLSRAAAKELGIIKQGFAQVYIYILN